MTPTRTWRTRRTEGGAHVLLLALLLPVLGAPAAVAQQEPPSFPEPPLPPLPPDPAEPGEPASPDPAEGGGPPLPLLPRGEAALARVGGEHVLWSTVTVGPLRVRLAAGAGRVHAMTDDGVLQAFHAASGESLWEARVGGRAAAPPVLVGDDVAVATADGTLVVFDGATGRRGQLALLGGTPTAPLASDGARLVAALRGGALLVLETAAWRIVQRASVPGAVTAAPLLAGGAVIVATRGGRVLAVDLVGGGIRWSHRLTGSIEADPVLVTRKEGPARVVVGTATGSVVALEVDTGRVAWRANALGGLLGATVAEDTVLLLQRDQRIAELEATTGVQRRTVGLGGTPAGPPAASAKGWAVALEGGRVEFLDDRLRRLGFVDLRGTFVGPPVSDGGGVFVGLRERLVYRLRF